MGFVTRRTLRVRSPALDCRLPIKCAAYSGGEPPRSVQGRDDRTVSTSRCVTSERAPGSVVRSVPPACQQSTAARSAAQASASRSPSRTHTRSTREAFGTTRRLSKLAAHSVGIPSSGPRDTSVGIFRTVRVTGAASTPLRTAIAADRVMTRNGRRPRFSISPHHTSPRRGSFTMAPPRSHLEATRARRPARPRWAACGGKRPRWRGRFAAGARAP